MTSVKQETASGKKSSKYVNLVGKHPNSEDKTEEKKSHTDWMQDADYSCVRSDFTVYPPSVPNARAFTRWELHDGSPRLFTTYQCKWGFKPTAGGTRNVYCVNSTWIGTTPKCQTVGEYVIIWLPYSWCIRNKDLISSHAVKHAKLFTVAVCRHLLAV